MIAVAPSLLGGVLNNLTVRVDPWVSNWLTPIWILGLGALAGVLVVLLLWLVGFGLSRVKAISDLSENRTLRLIAGAVLAAVLLAIWSPWLMGQLQDRWAQQVQQEVATNRFVDVLSLFAPAAVACLVAGVALMVLVSRRTMEELPLLFQEGPLFWVTVAVLSFAAFGILGTVVVRDPEGMLDSLRRWPELGRQEYTYTIPAAEGDQFALAAEHEIPLSIRMEELRTLTFESRPESLTISPFPNAERSGTVPLDISGGDKPLTYRRIYNPQGPFGELEEIDTLYVRNLGDRDATLRIVAQTAPAIPEMLTVPIIAVGVVGVFLIFIALWGMLPKLAAIAFATAKSEMNTPFYMILTVVGAFLLFMFLWLPYNTFGEDIKMLKFAALGVMLMFALLQTIWSASSSVADEVDGRTALTVLSKPVGRRDFVLGKFFGISWLVMVMLVVFGSVTLLTVAYKPIFDAKEGGKAPVRPNVADPLGIVDVRDTGLDTGLTQDEVTWQVCFAEMAATIPAIILIFFETVVMAAVAVAISTRLSLVPNFVICVSIFILGHLTPLMVQSAVVAERFEAVIFMGQLIAAVLPVLEYFNSEAAIAQGKAVQLSYVGATFVYTALYSTIAMLLALVLFEDRDLA
jgi:hypothetical protein